MLGHHLYGRKREKEELASKQSEISRGLSEEDKQRLFIPTRQRLNPKPRSLGRKSVVLASCHQTEVQNQLGQADCVLESKGYLRKQHV